MQGVDVGHDGFAGRLQKLRSERRMQKSQFARAVGVTPTCVWNWEQGNTHPRPEALARIAAALMTTPDFLETGRVPLPAPDLDGSSSAPPDIGSADQAEEEALLARAEALSGLKGQAVRRAALKALIALESGRRLARLGGSQPDLEMPPRRRPQ